MLVGGARRGANVGQVRRLRYSINVTLDGCVDHRAGVPSAGIHRNAVANIERADALILGRVTYELMEQAWRPTAATAPVDPTDPTQERPDWMDPFARAIDAAHKYVVSSTLEAVDWNAELLRGDLGASVRRLKEEPGEELFTGGVRLPLRLAELGLVDEYELVVHPRIAGHGPRLLEGLPTYLDLRLEDRIDLGEGIVAMRYVPRR